MRIAIFSDSFYPELSGITDMVISNGKELASQGHEIEFFVPKYSKKAYEIGNVNTKEIDLGPNIKINRVFSFPIKTPTMQGHAQIPNLLRGFLNKKKFDIIHTHGFFGAGIDALLFSKIAKIPLVGTNHTVIESFIQYFPVGARSEFFKKCLIKYLIRYYNFCDYVTTPSFFLLEDMKKKGLRVINACINNPVDPEFFYNKENKEVLKKKLSLTNFNALYTGRLSVEKNSETLLLGFIPFAEKYKNVSLSIIGQGLLREKLEKIAKESSVSDQIRFMGPFLGKNKKTLYDLFHASDVFVIPSTSEINIYNLFNLTPGFILELDPDNYNTPFKFR
jgi:1,2-diacylglycerol 3-alpha-glucosyltransferase